jgi:hypothetical protein
MFVRYIDIFKILSFDILAFYHFLRYLHSRYFRSVNQRSMNLRRTIYNTNNAYCINSIVDTTNALAIIFEEVGSKLNILLIIRRMGDCFHWSVFFKYRRSHNALFEATENVRLGLRCLRNESSLVVPQNWQPRVGIFVTTAINRTGGRIF